MSEFVEFLKEVFVEFGLIQARKMFGGYGIYYKGTMFGLVADDTLYLKADKEIAKLFIAKGLGPFEYDKGDKVVKMSYYVAPDDIFDDPHEAALWAQRSYDVAGQAKVSTKPKSTKGKKVSSKR
ncbi:MAG: TfoX/Sxy family protein [Nitrospirae bacterium]|nr:TfoX/Sxy family protein [Nitrospirota bacterium]MDA1303734.1 TfoX/Sxy family protein [Nitrospirota bacterium]